MLRSIPRSWAKLLLLVILITPVLTSAQRAGDDEPVDLSILSQANELRPYMTAEQRSEYLELQSAIESADSDLRSGQHLANTEPSPFDPDRDIKPIIERGEEMIESAQLRRDAAQEEIALLLKAVETQRNEREASALTRFDYALESGDYKEAMAKHARRLLESSWGLGYQAIFFDGLFIQDKDGTRRPPAELRNASYDTFVDIDSTRFSVSIPLNFKLNTDSTGEDDEFFNFENSSIFKNKKKALLIIELVLPEGSRTGLLSLKALDLKTLRIAAQEVVKINDMASILGLEGEDLEDKIPDLIKLRDQANTLSLLSNLPTPYQFEIQTDSETAEVAKLLSNTLLENSELELIDSDFILRAYGESLDVPESWQGPANASLLIGTDEQPGKYALRAQAYGSDRVLSAGTLMLSQDAPEPTESTE